MANVKLSEYQLGRATGQHGLQEWLAQHDPLPRPQGGVETLRFTSWCAWREGVPQLHVGAAHASVFWNRRPRDITCVAPPVPRDADPALLTELLRTILSHVDHSSPQPILLFFQAPQQLLSEFIPVPPSRRLLDRSEWNLLPLARECVRLREIDPPRRRALEDLYMAAALTWDGALCRDGSYWRSLASAIQAAGDVVLMEPEARGYARLRQVGGITEVVEIASINPLQDLVLLSSVIKEAKQESADMIVLDLPQGHALWGQLHSLGCRPMPEPAARAGVLMVRPPLARVEQLPGRLEDFHWNLVDWPE